MVSDRKHDLDPQIGGLVREIPLALGPSHLPGVRLSGPNVGGAFFHAMGSDFDLQLEDDLLHVSDGTVVNLVADIINSDNGISECCSLINKIHFKTTADLNTNCKRVTILQGIKQTKNGDIWIECSAYTVVYQRQSKPSIPLQAVEVCAGISAMGEGLRACQIQTKGYVEYNTNFCQQLLNQGKMNVFEGNVAHISTVVTVARNIPDIDVLIGGVACQPFSALGDRREQKDVRSESFPGMLRMGHFLQVPFMIIECTKEVLTSPWGQQVLSAFSTKTNMKVEQQILHLHTLWPSHRTRWWAIVSPVSHDIMPIPHFPDISWEPSILHLMPVMMKISPHELKQLELDLFELRQFHASPKGISEHTLKPMKAMPTATHSWGSQLTECKCGCRSSGFSLARIQKSGLYGVLWPLHDCVKLGVEEVTKFRHLHPKEVSLLCGMSPQGIPESQATHLRMSLAGVGQMASPLHAAWVGGHLVESLHMHSHIDVTNMKYRAVASVVEKLFEARDALLPHGPRTRYMDIFEAAVHTALSVPSQSESVESGELTQAMLSKVIEAEAEHGETNMSHPSAFTDDEIPDDVLQKELEQRNSQIKIEDPLDANEDPYWECPYEDCFICDPKLKIQLEGSDSSHQILPAKSHEQSQISPTLHFTAHEGNIEERNASEIPSDTPTQVQSQSNRVMVDKFDNDGGIPSFLTSKRQRVGEKDNHHSHQQSHQQPIVPARVVAGDPIKEHDPIHHAVGKHVPSFTKPEECGDLHVETKADSQNQYRIVQVVHAESKAPILVKAEIDTTLGELLCAEAKIRGVRQVEAVDAIGQKLSPHDLLTPFQRIHICQLEGSESHKNIFTDSFDHRFHALLNQGPWVANDEMDFYLVMISKCTKAHKVQPLVVCHDHVVADSWVYECVSTGNHENPVVSAVLTNGHWVPIVLFRLQTQTIVHTSSEGAELVKQLFETYVGIQVSVGSMGKRFEHDCGFQTVGWINYILTHCQGNSQDTPQDIPTVEPKVASEWRSLFDNHLHGTGQAKIEIQIGEVHFGGTKNETLEKQLGNILLEHGVPLHQVEERCNIVFETLGRAAVLQATRSPRPWQELKALANAQLPKLQLILPSELSASIKAKLESKADFGYKKVKKPQDKRQQTVIQLRPEVLSIPNMIFKQGTDEAVQQIPFAAIGTDSKGVVLVTAEQATPYLALQQPISKYGLALLVLDHSHTVCSGVGQVIRFPAQCHATNEPIIATARLIQLGQIEISRHLPESQLRVEEVQTSVIRVVVYRDEFEDDWSAFVQHPVKHVLKNCAELQSTTHSDLEILDVWDRQFVNMKLEKVKATESSIFIVTIRVKGIEHKALLTSTSVGGMYVEPRTDDGRKPSPDYRVVWLQKVNKATAISAVQSSRQWASIVRSGNRFGIRTTIDSAEAVHQQHKPNTPYIDSSSMVSYMVGPWPYGATRHGLQKVFDKWGWEARPLQPRGRSADSVGVLWEVQAAQKPKYEVYSMEHSDVLITEIRKKKPMDHQPSDVLASAQTIAILKHQQNQHSAGNQSNQREVDKVFLEDPWKNWHPPSKVAKSSSSSSATQQVAQADVIQASVERKFAAAFAALEEKVNARDIAMPAETDHSKVAELEARVSNIEGAVQQQSMQLQQHQTHVSQQFGQIQAQVDQQASSLQRHLDQRLQEQLGHIERLLHKKPRENQE